MDLIKAVENLEYETFINRYLTRRELSTTTRDNLVSGMRYTCHHKMIKKYSIIRTTIPCRTKGQHSCYGQVANN